MTTSQACSSDPAEALLVCRLENKVTVISGNQEEKQEEGKCMYHLEDMQPEKGTRLMEEPPWPSPWCTRSLMAGARSRLTIVVTCTNR